MLANGAAYRTMATEFVNGYPFIYFSRVPALIAGLAILNAHNAWTRDWRSLITALGWFMTFAGSFRIIAPQYVSFLGSCLITHHGFIVGAGVAVLALGGFITFNGDAAEAASASQAERDYE
jgi:hypothetical protein